MDEAVQPAPAGKPGTGTLPAGRPEDGRRVHYERRRPEDTALYQRVQEHLETSWPKSSLRPGRACQSFDCGILARGFLRLRCADCAHEKLVAFSCKRRGFCPSCGARRMAETAAHVVDHVIPRVPMRQWMLSFPIPLRLLYYVDTGGRPNHSPNPTILDLQWRLLEQGDNAVAPVLQ